MEVEGKVDRVFFEGDDGFKILLLTLSDGGKITLKGNLGYVEKGDYIKAKGFFRENPKYGEEFVVEEFEFLEEKNLLYIVKFLSSGIIKGIRKGLSERIVEKFGEKTVEILKNSPEKLLEVKGIGEKNLKLIKESLKEKKEIFDSYLFLSELGVGPVLSEKIYSFYKEETVKIIKKNPYLLIEDIEGIGFKTADSIARKVGIEKDSPLRIKSFIIHVLIEEMEKGNTFIHIEELEKRVKREIEVGKNDLYLYLQELERDGKIVIDRNAISLSYLYSSEKNISHFLKILMDFPSKTLELSEDEITEIEEEEKIKLSSEQKEAVFRAFKEKVFIITGGPGTGKTTIIKFLGKVFKRKGFRFKFTSPTGRASKRITEATGFPAQTIHRLLEYNPFLRSFSKNRFNPLHVDAVVVDEVSMVDVLLFEKLLSAIHPSSKLILVGDHNQLPPVGPGYPLRDLINSSKIPFIELKKIYRQKEDSLITYNAHRIKRGEFPEIPLPSGEKIYDFYFIKRSEEKKIYEAIIELYVEKIPDMFSVDPFSDKIQVLSPLYRGEIGVDNLNKNLQRILNKSVVELKSGERIFKLGDKVMQIKNNYEKEVFNGDLGRIVEINDLMEYLTVDFYGRKVNYFRGEFGELTLSYAISVHKSQGSEYDYVIMPLSRSHTIMLRRNLIYTALTRAKKMMILVGELVALRRGIDNNEPLLRNSFLEDFIRENFTGVLNVKKSEESLQE